MDFSTMNWRNLLESPAAISLYVALILFIYRKLNINHQWNTERWNGLISAAYLAAEASGALGSQPKLQFALQDFGRQYQETFGKPALAGDLKDAALDFARMALTMKNTAPAELSSATVKI